MCAVHTVKILMEGNPVTLLHIRRGNTKEKAKVIAAVWGTTFIKFLVRACYFALG